MNLNTFLPKGNQNMRKEKIRIGEFSAKNYCTLPPLPQFLISKAIILFRWSNMTPFLQKMRTVIFRIGLFNVVQFFRMTQGAPRGGELDCTPKF